jgi:hypothetical protein
MTTVSLTSWEGEIFDFPCIFFFIQRKFMDYIAVQAQKPGVDGNGGERQPWGWREYHAHHPRLPRAVQVKFLKDYRGRQL